MWSKINIHNTWVEQNTQTSEEAGRKPKPIGALSSSLHPFTPGLKCNSTWKRSSEEGSYRYKCQQMKQEQKLGTKGWSGHISYLVIVLIQHNNNLCHIVEFGHCAEVVHSLLPLFIFLFLNRQRWDKTVITCIKHNAGHNVHVWWLLTHV